MASQAAAFAAAQVQAQAQANQWNKISNGITNQSAISSTTFHPNGSPVNGMNLADLSSLIASNPTMASLYFGNIPRMTTGISPSSMLTSQQSQQQQSPSQIPTSTHHQNNNNGIPSNILTPSPGGSSSTGGPSPFIPPSNHNSNPSSHHPSPSPLMHPAALYAASTMQLTNLYSNLKSFHPYLHPRFITSHLNNQMTTHLNHLNHQTVANGKVEIDLSLTSPHSPSS